MADGKNMKSNIFQPNGYACPGGPQRREMTITFASSARPLTPTLLILCSTTMRVVAT
jgi:hypothetical protein